MQMVIKSSKSSKYLWKHSFRYQMAYQTSANYSDNLIAKCKMLFECKSWIFSMWSMDLSLKNPHSSLYPPEVLPPQWEVWAWLACRQDPWGWCHRPALPSPASQVLVKRVFPLPRCLHLSPHHNLLPNLYQRYNPLIYLVFNEFYLIALFKTSNFPINGHLFFLSPPLLVLQT